MPERDPPARDSAARDSAARDLVARDPIAAFMVGGLVLGCLLGLAMPTQMLPAPVPAWRGKGVIAAATAVSPAPFSPTSFSGETYPVTPAVRTASSPMEFLPEPPLYDEQDWREDKDAAEVPGNPVPDGTTDDRHDGRHDGDVAAPPYAGPEMVVVPEDSDIASLSPAQPAD